MKQLKWQVQVLEGWMLGVHSFKTKYEAVCFVGDWLKVATDPDAVNKIVCLWTKRDKMFKLYFIEDGVKYYLNQHNDMTMHTTIDPNQAFSFIGNRDIVRYNIERQHHFVNLIVEEV